MNDSIYQADLNGVFVWNPQPSEDETVLWNGPAIDGYAEGAGQLVWYWRGVIISVYEGTLHKGKPHGRGKYEFADGDIYEGQWLDGLRHGSGKHWYKDGKIYEGNWIADKPGRTE